MITCSLVADTAFEKGGGRAYMKYFKLTDFGLNFTLKKVDFGQKERN